MSKQAGRAAFVILALCVASAGAQSGANPFDSRRLDAPAPIASTAAVAGAKAGGVASPRKGVFCGMIEDLDRLSACVDGVWMSQEKLQLRTSAKVVWASSTVLKLSTGKIVVVGEVFPSWKMSANDKEVK